MNYDAQRQTLGNYDVGGKDPICKVAVTSPREAGEIWLEGGAIVPLSSATCTLRGVKQYQASGKKVAVAYVYDKALGIKVFADRAYYAATGPGKALVPFLLKKDAEANAAKAGTTVLSYEQALAATGR